MVEKLLILDFDNTLGDTYGPGGTNDVLKSLSGDRIHDEQVYESCREGSAGVVPLKKYLRALGITDDPYELFQNKWFENNLYPDAKTFLDAMTARDDVVMTIVTTGDRDWQTIKTEYSGVTAYMQDIRITDKRDKTEEILYLLNKYQPKEAWYVDDRVHVNPADFPENLQIIHMDRDEKMPDANNVIRGFNELKI